MREDPLISLRPGINSIRSEAERLLETLSAPKPIGPTPGDIATEAILGHVTGGIASEIFGRRRTGSRIGRAIARSGRQTQIAQSAAQTRAQAVALVHQARQVVNSASPMVGPRVSQSLLRGLADAESSRRPDTILRKVLQATGRLEAFRASVPAELPRTAAPEALIALERALRQCIEKRLSAVSESWWAKRVPEEQRNRAERRRARRENVWPWLDAGEHSIVEYLDFPDYAKIILEPANWKEAFSAVFADEDALRVKLRELEPIRVDIAHARVLTDAHRRRLETYAEDLLAAIRATP